jgi:hypothetical protein
VDVSKPSSLRLLDLAPDLAEHLPAGERAEARRLVMAEVVDLPRGIMTAAGGRDGRGARLHGLLLLDGLVGRTVALAETTAVELLGAGDLLEAQVEQRATGLVPIGVSWAVLEPARAVIVDDRLLRSMQRWPELTAALLERVAAQAARLATRCAISQLPRTEDRLETLLWFLAERWGRVAVDGLVLPLRLTHEVLGQMLGAKRPTVSLALKTLEREGTVRRREDGAWLLRWPEETDVSLPRPSAFGVRLLWRQPTSGAGAMSSSTAGPRPERVALSDAARARADQLTERIERLSAQQERTRERSILNVRNATLTRQRSAELRRSVRAEARLSRALTDR